MKTFLKILLIVVAVLVAIKLLPLTLAAGFILAAVALTLLVVTASAAAALFAIALVMAAVLAPIWLPVLAVFGIIALCRRHRAPRAV